MGYTEADCEDLKVSKAFWEWWSSGGSEEWATALDAEKGTLGALEMVFTRAIQLAYKDDEADPELAKLQATIDKMQNAIDCGIDYVKYGSTLNKNSWDLMKKALEPFMSDSAK